MFFAIKPRIRIRDNPYKLIANSRYTLIARAVRIELLLTSQAVRSNILWAGDSSKDLRRTAVFEARMYLISENFPIARNTQLAANANKPLDGQDAAGTHNESTRWLAKPGARSMSGLASFTTRARRGGHLSSDGLR